MTAPADVTEPVGRRRAGWQAALTLTLLLVLGCLARRHWPAVETGAVRLAVADQGWLLAGAAAAGATWAASALAQQGAVVPRLPAGRLLAAQFAASAANQLLPAGLGAGAVTLRFLMRCGLSVGRSAGALTVRLAASVVVRGALIALLAPACPKLLSVPHLSAPSPAAVLTGLCAAGLCAGALLGTPPAGRIRLRCAGACAALLADVRAVHRRPARAVALWGGSLAFALLHCLVLVSVTRAVELPLPWPRVALLYLVASTAAALLPTPGGLGSLDAALGLALTVSGAPGATAVGAVLGYRLLTVWLPLVPGLVVLGVLIRRKAL